MEVLDHIFVAFWMDGRRFPQTVKIWRKAHRIFWKTAFFLGHFGYIVKFFVTFVDALFVFDRREWK